MMENEQFDDLRPYYDAEINAAMHRIIANEFFPALSGYVFPGRDIEDVRRMLRDIRTIDDFQLQVMKAVNEQVISRSIGSFTFEGLDGLDNSRRYLFVSNHRDIMLDATLLQYALYQSGLRTSEITFGSNLMSSQLAIDIGRSNKMFKVIRGGNIKDFYTNSLRLSEYIRYTITRKRESVWIAQRNGRTKDGIDATDQALVKMFYMSAQGDPVRALAELNIVPVSISYQWESCDLLKAMELYVSRTEKYVKQPGEDLHSILTGIIQQKGDVHISVGKLLTEDVLASLSDLPGNKFNRQVAQWLDGEIIRNYRLTCNNYIAADMLAGNDTYADRYTADEKAAFVAHLTRLDTVALPDKDELREIFLGIYANPVATKEKQ